MVPALARNSIIVETNACRGKWSMHAVAISDKFFYTSVIFLIKKNAKNEDRLCPLPYEEVLEDIIIKTVWTEQCGYL